MKNILKLNGVLKLTFAFTMVCALLTSPAFAVENPTSVEGDDQNVNVQCYSKVNPAEKKFGMSCRVIQKLNEGETYEALIKLEFDRENLDMKAEVFSHESLFSVATFTFECRKGDSELLCKGNMNQPTSALMEGLKLDVLLKLHAPDGYMEKVELTVNLDRKESQE